MIGSLPAARVSDAHAAITNLRITMWNQFLLSSVLQLVRTLVKNPGRAAELRTQLIALRDAISAVYPESA
jgi:hypothetical protein